MSSPPSPTIVRLMIFGGTWPSPYFPGWVGIVNGLVPPVFDANRWYVRRRHGVAVIGAGLDDRAGGCGGGVVVGVATIGRMFGQTLLWVWWSATRRLRY